MITFKQFLSEALDPEKLYQKYYSDMDKTDFYTIMELDPTIISKRGKIRKVGKYVKFIMNWYKKFPGCIHEDLNGALTYFIDNQSEFKPIERYKDCGSFVDDVNLKKETMKMLEKSNPIIHETSNWKIRELNTEHGSQYFGADRGWCTANRENCYFERYKESGNLYVFYQKPKEKPYAQLFIDASSKESEFMFPYNEAADIDEFIKETRELKSWFKKIGLEEFNGMKFRGRKLKYEVEDNVIVFESLSLEDLNLSSLEEFVDELPFGLKQYKIISGFYCDNNKLTSLEGAPKSVGGSFSCSHNNLISLEGAPEEIDEYFNCGDNNLPSLKGAPRKVGDHFYCWENRLTTLEGAPEYVGGNFNCSTNMLTSLEGAPRKIGGEFECDRNNIRTLEGGPEYVEKDFNCSASGLHSFKGAPKYVGKNFKCFGNPMLPPDEVPDTKIGGMLVR